MQMSPMEKKSKKNLPLFSLDSSTLLQTVANQQTKFSEEVRKSWKPKYCGEINMRIARDGTWYYYDSPIGRKEIVKLFSSILIREVDKYFLITPVEKVGITVDDVPFIAVDFQTIIEHDITYLVFQTNIDQKIILGSSNPIRIVINEATQEPSPYILVRENIEARIDRKSFYRLIELGEYSKQNGIEYFGIRSGNTFFPIIAKSELEVQSIETPLT